MVKMILDTKKGKKTLFLSSNLTYLLTQHALDIKNLSFTTYLYDSIDFITTPKIL